MNYLAHLHIAWLTNTSFSGNFLGDFVKGDPEQGFPDEIVKGIRLHRHVDSFIDKHPLVLSAKNFFPKHLRRYSPIALDMFWDHFLALHWSHFTDFPLSDFCVLAEKSIAKETKNITLPERFQRVNGWVWKDEWLASYQKIGNIEYALQRMSARSVRMAPLSDTPIVLELHYDQLRELFFQIYADVISESQSFAINYKKGG